MCDKQKRYVHCTILVSDNSGSISMEAFFLLEAFVKEYSFAVYSACIFVCIQNYLKEQKVERTNK